MRSIKDIFRSYAEFNAEGKHVNGTDKESNHHYGDTYESLFIVKDVKSEPSNTIHMSYPRSRRLEVELMMEVGVADGSCLLAWRDVFPNATIVGMDIHHSDKAHGERIEFHLGNASNQADCVRAAAGRQFDLIVDDATHLLEDALRTLFYLWPSVRPGGLYVIEEFYGGPAENITAMWPFAEIIPTMGPFGGIEPLVVLRRPI